MHLKAETFGVYILKTSEYAGITLTFRRKSDTIFMRYINHVYATAESRRTDMLKTEIEKINVGEGTELSYMNVSVGDATATYVTVKMKDGNGKIILTPVQPKCDSYMAIENHSPYWCRPAFGKNLADLPQKVQALFLKNGETYHCILPVCADTWKTVIRGSESGMQFCLYTQCKTVTDCNRQLAWVEMSGENPLELAEKCAETVATLLGNGFKMRRERNYPPVLDYLGWCSWDAFQIRVSEKGLLEKAKEFKDKQVPVRFAIIDDMWADVPHLAKVPEDISFSAMVGEMHGSKMRSFEGDSVRFPNGMKTAVEHLKQSGIDRVGIWFPTTGYWFGMEKGGAIYNELQDDLMTEREGRNIVKPEISHTTHYFGNLCRKAKSWGADFVKIDNQGCQQYYEGVDAIGRTAKAVQTGIECAVEESFDGAIINCMGMPSECMYNRPDSAVSRCSDDFMPENREWFTKNILQCAYNGLLQGRFYVNDWDMWWTDDGQAKKNSLCRAISGGPVYVSDKLGRTNPEILKPVCLSDGKLIRPDESATPTADCITVDPRTSEKIFKVRNKIGDRGICAVFNLDKDEKSVTGTVSAEDVGMQSKRIVLYDWFEGKAKLLECGEKIDLTLQNAEEYKLYWMIPYVSGGVTVVGKPDLYTGCGAIVLKEDGMIEIPDGGEVLLASKSAVRLSVDGKIYEGEQNGILWKFTLPSKAVTAKIL